MEESGKKNIYMTYRKVKVAQFGSGFSQPNRLYRPWNSPGLSVLQRIFPTQRLNPGLPHGRQILNWLATREAQEY